MAANAGRESALKGSLYPWAVIAIAVVSTILAEVYGRTLLLETSIIRARPIFLIGLGMLGLWLVVWLTSLRRRAVPWPIALATFAITAFQPLRWIGMWDCVVGVCEW